MTASQLEQHGLGISESLSNIEAFKRLYIGKRGKGHKVGSGMYKAILNFMKYGFPNFLDEIEYELDNWLELANCVKKGESMIFDIKSETVNYSVSTDRIIEDLVSCIHGVQRVHDIALEYERYELCGAMKLIANQMQVAYGFKKFKNRHLDK